MAKQDISLNIGTKFNGEGLKKLNSAMATASGQARNASKAITGIQSALGGVGGEAGKVVGQIGGVVQAFTQMGIAGGIIAAGTAAIQGLFKWLNKTNEALSELAKGFGDRLKTAVSKASAEIAKINKAFADMIGQNKTKNERQDIVNGSALGFMEEQKKQALTGKEGVEAAKIEYEWTKKIEAERERQSKKHLEDVQEEIKLTEENLKKQQQGQREAYAKFKSANTLALDISNSKGFDEVEKNKAFDDARIAKSVWKAYDKPIEELQKKLEQLKTQELKVEQEANLAPMKRQTAEMTAAQKIKDEQKKVDEAEAKRLKEIEDEKKKNAEAFVKGYADDQKKELEKQAKEDASKAISKRQEEGAEEQKKLNEELQKAQRAVKDWIDSFKNNKHTNFADFNKGMNQAAKDNAVQVLDANGNAVVGPDGEPLTMDKKQANKVKSNRQQLDRLLKMKNPDARTRKEIERRQAFDDMFNGEKIKERMKKEEDARKAKEEADRKMRADIDALKKMIVDDNGVAI